MASLQHRGFRTRHRDGADGSDAAWTRARRQRRPWQCRAQKLIAELEKLQAAIKDIEAKLKKVKEPPFARKDDRPTPPMVRGTSRSGPPEFSRGPAPSHRPSRLRGTARRVARAHSGHGPRGFGPGRGESWLGKAKETSVSGNFATNGNWAAMKTAICIRWLFR